MAEKGGGGVLLSTLYKDTDTALFFVKGVKKTIFFFCVD